MNNQEIASIDDYLTNLPAGLKSIMQKIRETIHEAAPDATETVSYGMPTFNMNGKHFIYFAAWKQHISIYPLYNKGGEMHEELAPYLKEKDSLHLPMEEPFPYDLVTRIVHMKLKELDAPR